MSSEEVHIIGILNENHATETISLKELRALICDYVQVAPYYPVLLEVLAQNGEALQEKTKIDLQSIFKAIISTYFTKNIPSYYGNRITKYSVKLIKAALVTYTRGLLTMAEIRDGASIHQMKEFETLSIGVACNVQTIHSMLWVMKKTINNELLEKWISVHTKYLEQPGMLMVNEFLYLLCNCVNKQEMLHKIPKIPMNVKMDKKTKLFHVDKEFPNTYETPDHKIQYMMSSFYNVDKASIEGVSLSAPKNQNVVIKSSRKRLSKIDPQEDQADSFRQQLRSMVMTVGIKVKLKEYHQKLIRSRLNGKAAYDKLVAQGEEALPAPLDLENPMKNNDNNALKNRKKPAILARPHTAGHRPMSASYSGSFTPRPPALKSPNFASTATSRVFGSPQNTLKDMMSPNVTRRKSSKYSENVLKFQAKLGGGEISNFPVKPTYSRKNSLASTNTTQLSKDPDLIHAFENIVGEEYSLFEQKSQIVKRDRRSKSSSYFNAAFISPNVTRIYSSKPGSPAAATPLSTKLFF